MNATLFQNDDCLKAIVDAMPSAVFVVDHSFKIFDMNLAATKLFGVDSNVILRRLCGEIMHCMHAFKSKEGCGTTAFCPDCVIRNSVELACKGKTVHRDKYRMKIQRANEITDAHFLINAAPFKYEGDKFILLVVEDITEIITLKRLLPICSNCKKIRNDEDYWEAVADYLKKHADLEFTHSICPECANKLYPDLDV